MATYVCYRSCCRQLQQYFTRSFHSARQVSVSSQHGALGMGRPVASPLLRLCQTSRFYHTIHSAGKKTGFHNAFTNTRSVLWRSFRSRNNNQPEVKNNNSQSNYPELLRPFAFTVFACSSSFIGCMIWQYEGLRTRAQAVMDGLDRQFNKMFEPTYQKELGFRAHMNNMWNSFSDGEKMVAAIIGMNFVVFSAWRVPQISNVLVRYFTSLPGNPAVSMILSAFSHVSLWHIAANMYVLWSFTNVSTRLFGKEQWLAVYLSAACLSSFASLLNKVIRFKSMPMVPSLGASGAIMCLLGAVCVTHPDARLSVAFVGELFPHSFSASSALKFILLLDTAGLVMGWRLFDHAAHLGGVLFGIWYATYGHKMIWGQREKVMKYWHEMRGKPKK